MKKLYGEESNQSIENDNNDIGPLSNIKRNIQNMQNLKTSSDENKRNFENSNFDSKEVSSESSLEINSNSDQELKNENSSLFLDPKNSSLNSPKSSSLESKKQSSDSKRLSTEPRSPSLFSDFVDIKKSPKTENFRKPPSMMEKDFKEHGYSVESNQSLNNSALDKSVDRIQLVQPISMEPISKVTNFHQSYRRLTDNSTEDSDPLTELKNIAKLESNSFKNIYDDTQETYFSPPVSPSKLKNPFQQFFKKKVKEENFYKETSSPELKIKPRRQIKEPSNSMEEMVDDEQNVASDQENAKFNYNPESKLFYCPWENCGKFFPSLSRIKRHYIIHTKEKPFKCLNKECMRRFSRKDNMLQHHRVHCPFTSNRNA